VTKGITNRKPELGGPYTTCSGVRSQHEGQNLRHLLRFLRKVKHCEEKEKGVHP